MKKKTSTLKNSRAYFPFPRPSPLRGKYKQRKRAREGGNRRVYRHQQLVYIQPRARASQPLDPRPAVKADLYTYIHAHAREVSNNQSPGYSLICTYLSTPPRSTRLYAISRYCTTLRGSLPLSPSFKCRFSYRL